MSGMLGKTKSFQKEKHHKNFVFILHWLHPLEEGAPIFTFVDILFVTTISNPSVVRMGHTPYTRSILLLGFAKTKI